MPEVLENPVQCRSFPPGGALIRTSYMPTHTDEMLDEALELMEDMGKKYKII